MRTVLNTVPTGNKIGDAAMAALEQIVKRLAIFVVQVNLKQFIPYRRQFIVISIVFQPLHVQQFFLGACSDSNEDPWRQYCSSWKNYCSSHTGVRANCKKTCNLCDGDGGRKEMIL